MAVPTPPLLTRPVALWNRGLKIALHESPAAGLKTIVEALSAVDLKDDPAGLSWLLVQRALIEAVYELAKESEIEFVEGLPPQAEPLGAELDTALESVQVTLDERFFQHPEGLPVLPPFQERFARWLELCRLDVAAARAVAHRLPPYFVVALNREWLRRPEEYAPLRSALDTPFTGAAARERAWLIHAAALRRRVAEPVFAEPFGLSDIYIPPRAWYAERPEPPAGPRTRAEAEPERRHVVDLTEHLRQWALPGDRHDALRVLSGGPGSGKSSFVRVFAAALAGPDRRVLVIPLHRFDPAANLEQAVKEFVRVRDLGLESPLDPAERTRLLLLFDGLDELAAREGGEKLARDFVEHVHTTLNQRNAAELRLQVLITGRELAVQAHAGAFRAPGQLLHLLPYLVPEGEREEYEDPAALLPADQRQAWWQQYGRARGREYPGLPEPLRREDLDEITAQPLLNYLVARSWEGGTVDFSGAVSRNEIYADLLRQVYERPWGEGGAEPGHPGTGALSFEAFVRVLEEIALVVWHGNGRTAPLAAIQEQCAAAGLAELLAEFTAAGQQPQGLMRLLMAFYLREQALGPTAGDAIEFTHKSFGEYLVARRLVTGLEDMRLRLEPDPRRRFAAPPREADALEQWARLCGPASLTRELLDFLRDEVALRPGDAALWQPLLVRLINTVLRDGMPMEKIPTLATYRQMDEQARSAELALLAALDACARVTRTVSQIDWPKITSFHAWLVRLEGEEIGSGTALPSRCLCTLDLRGADLRGAYLTEAYLTEAYLTGADLTRAYLTEAYLTGADLTGADLTGADLRWAYLTGADLTGANLTGANLTEAYLTGADLRGARYDPAQLQAARNVESAIQGQPEDAPPGAEPPPEPEEAGAPPDAPP